MPVFISHSHQDNAAYSSLCLLLDTGQVPRWDVRKMLPGCSLAEQLRRAIEECSVCILLATAASLKAQWCLAEAGAFWGAGKRVVVFVADSSVKGESDLPPQFQGNLWTNDASQLLRAITEALEEARRLRGRLKQNDGSRDSSKHLTEIGPRGIEALTGRWSGFGTQAHGHAGEDYKFPMSFGLVVEERRVFGTFEIEYPKNGETYKAILSCSGGFFYESFLRLIYEHVNEEAVHFGAIMAFLRPGTRKLTGRFLGYGDISEDIVYGTFEVSKVDLNKSENRDTEMFSGKVEWAVYHDQIRSLRHDAFVLEEGFTPSFINDERDTSFSHVCVLKEGKVVGCVRYTRSGHLERLAIHREHRGRVFRNLWASLEREAKSDGVSRVFGYVQEKNMPLFQREGCVATGRSTMLDAIQHYELEKRI